MSNELFSAASEIQLNLAANQVEQALVAACTGLKRFLNDPHQVRAHGVARGSTGLANDSASIARYVDQLEEALEAAEIEPMLARILLPELRIGLETTLKPEGKKRPAAVSASRTTANGDGDARQVAFQRVIQLKEWICRLPAPFSDGRARAAEREAKRGLWDVALAVAAGGAVVWLATPAALGLLGAPLIAGANLAAEEVFGKAIERASDRFKGVEKKLGDVAHDGCKCSSSVAAG